VFRAALSYHPDIGTFRGKRGAWRVVACWTPSVHEHSHICTGPWSDTLEATARKVLFVNVTKRLHPNTFCNPTALLRRRQLVLSTH